MTRQDDAWESDLSDLCEALRELSLSVVDARRSLGVLRSAVVSGGTQGVLDATAGHEQVSARIAQLEARRACAQRAVENALGVRGLVEIAVDPRIRRYRRELQNLMSSVSTNVLELRGEESETSTLLRSAIQTAQRTRRELARLAGGSGYDRHGSEVGTT